MKKYFYYRKIASAAILSSCLGFTSVAPSQTPTQQQQTQQQQIQKPTQSQSQQLQIQQSTQNQGQQQQTQNQQQVQKPTQQQSQQQTFVKIGPKWKIGTSWVVETKNLQNPISQKQESEPVHWTFIVAGEAKIGNRDCYEIRIRCNDPSNRQPRVAIWVDKHSGMLMRTTTQQLVQNQWQSFTDNYSVPEGKSTAVLGTIPSLPLDMPLFTDDSRSKDIEGMSYELIPGNKGSKNLGEVDFAFRLNQSIKPISDEKSKSLAKDPRAKSLPETVDLQNAVEVELQSGLSKSTVRQVWSSDLPWPVFSTNGISESRLIEIKNPQ